MKIILTWFSPLQLAIGLPFWLSTLAKWPKYFMQKGFELLLPSCFLSLLLGDFFFISFRPARSSSDFRFLISADEIKAFSCCRYMIDTHSFIGSVVESKNNLLCWRWKSAKEMLMELASLRNNPNSLSLLNIKTIFFVFKNKNKNEVF